MNKQVDPTTLSVQACQCTFRSPIFSSSEHPDQFYDLWNRQPTGSGCCKSHATPNGIGGMDRRRAAPTEGSTVPQQPAQPLVSVSHSSVWSLKKFLTRVTRRRHSRFQNQTNRFFQGVASLSPRAAVQNSYVLTGLKLPQRFLSLAMNAILFFKC